MTRRRASSVRARSSESEWVSDPWSARSIDRSIARAHTRLVRRAHVAVAVDADVVGDVRVDVTQHERRVLAVRRVRGGVERRERRRDLDGRVALENDERELAREQRAAVTSYCLRSKIRTRHVIPNLAREQRDRDAQREAVAGGAVVVGAGGGGGGGGVVVVRGVGQPAAVVLRVRVLTGDEGVVRPRPGTDLVVAAAATRKGEGGGRSVRRNNRARSFRASPITRIDRGSEARAFRGSLVPAYFCQRTFE